MQSIVPICFLCLLIVQQIINVTSVASIKLSSDKEVRRMHVGRRLRAPLMGRSIPTTLNDDANLPKSNLYGSSNSDENEFVSLNKRRYSLASLSEQRWINSKRQRPLYG